MNGFVEVVATNLVIEELITVLTQYFCFGGISNVHSISKILINIHLSFSLASTLLPKSKQTKVPVHVLLV